VQACPSATQVEAHENPTVASRHDPEQHSAGWAQLAEAARQPASPPAPRHLWTPGSEGKGAQVSPAQQSGLAPHVSPSAPQVGIGAGWQIPIAPSWPVHVPEQQSAFEVHSSHSTRQPPSGAQRFWPPGSITQSLEQQSSLPMQTSPTCFVQPAWSLPMHMGSGAQWPTDCGSRLQTELQQSELEPQTSPWTRQPSRSAQCPPAHTWPQHSGLPPQASPAGLHMGGGGAHCPPMHTLLQQAAAVAHGLPAEAHAGPSPHAPVTPPIAPPDARHDSEQHWPANVHDPGSPSQPTVGRHTPGPTPLFEHQPEQHWLEASHAASAPSRVHGPSCSDGESAATSEVGLPSPAFAPSPPAASFDASSVASTVASAESLSGEGSRTSRVAGAHAVRARAAAATISRARQRTTPQDYLFREPKSAPGVLYGQW
jgi:hypothetical protein